ncbi:hypothetical protein CBW18_15060 [Pedobacter sp. AJM]|jgi:hypothetical protein|nr:hypothetical protein CBW18_15060 [Pedobacter sp. AJM]
MYNFHQIFGVDNCVKLVIVFRFENIEEFIWVGKDDFPLPVVSQWFEQIFLKTESLKCEYYFNPIAHYSY